MLTRMVVIIEFHDGWLEICYFHFLLHRKTVALNTLIKLESERNRVRKGLFFNILYPPSQKDHHHPLRPSTDTLYHPPALLQTTLSSHPIQVDVDLVRIKFHLLYTGFVFQLLEHGTKR